LLGVSSLWCRVDVFFLKVMAEVVPVAIDVAIKRPPKVAL